MTKKVFVRKVTIRAPVSKVFSWHAKDGAINRLTPPWAPLALVARKGKGIAYICLQMQDGYDPLKTKWLLHIHVFASLYGWNLCGLAVICRFDDFPIRLHSTTVIMVHWLTALVLAPLGIFQGWFAVLAIVGYAFITLTLFFSGNGHINYDQ